jgi:hypothetical protein
MFNVWRLAFGVWRLAFGVWRLAFGVWRLAFGVWRARFEKSKRKRSFAKRRPRTGSALKGQSETLRPSAAKRVNAERRQMPNANVERQRLAEWT